MVYAISVDPVTGCEPPSNFTYNVLQGGFLDVVDTIRVCEGSPYSISALASDTVDWDGTRSFDYTGVLQQILYSRLFKLWIVTQQVVLLRTLTQL